MFPPYRLPPRLLISICLSWCGLRRRSFQEDAQQAIASLQVAPVILGREHFPSSACLVTFNHYQRGGFGIQWLVIAIAAALPVVAAGRLHAIMTAEFTYPGQWFGVLGRPLSRLVLGRLAHIYGFSCMPPMPPRARDVAARAQAVNNVLTWLDSMQTIQSAPAWLLLAPEGADQPDDRLGVPPAGVGRFIALLAQRGLCILPAAAWEQAGVLHVRFGPTYQLNLPPNLPRAELDQAISVLVMQKIADQLPEPG
ncbi:MAG: hypothetical protein WCK35_26925 [Chloroflexota bacterium]